MRSSASTPTTTGCTGPVKMWLALQPQGIPVAKSTVERLMRRHGLAGRAAAEVRRTTIADPAADRPPDLVDRQFGCPRRTVLVVADL